MFDVFYLVRPTGLFTHERLAIDLRDAARQSRTGYFWLLDGRNDYADFDVHWLPNRWDLHCVHVFRTQWNRPYAFFSAKNVDPDPSKQQRIEHPVIRKPCGPVYYIDYGEEWSDKKYLELESRGLAVERIDAGKGPLSIIKHIAQRAKDAWIISSQRDYSQFDFSWHPEVWDQDWLHVFDQGTMFARDAVLRPYRDEPCYIEIAKNAEQQSGEYCKDARQPLDIVYVSNGEVDAERWWKHLQKITAGRENRLLRVQNVPDRTRALHQAALVSNSDWFFVVPAKLEMSADFDWSWQPPTHIWPAHYVFNCLNPVNGLEYGHMAMVAYNRELVLDTTEATLDFTMSRPYAVVPQVVGVAHYNAEPEMAWRTAFREAVKLKISAEKGDQVSAERLTRWLSMGQGLNAEWSQLGAQDGVDYYEQVAGDMSALLETYYWSWLGDRFRSLYPVGLRQT